MPVPQLSPFRRTSRAMFLPLLVSALLLPGAIAQTTHPTTNQSPSAVIVEGTDGSMAHHGEHNLHMRLTPVRSPNAEDQEKADELAHAIKAGIAQYADIPVAEADGYRPFPPDPSGLRIVHYVNLQRSWQESFQINPAEPGSLLYERQPNGSLRLIGAMLSAPAEASKSELDERVSLSVTRWHLHTNICVPKPIWDREQWAIENQGKPRFGPESAISSASDCGAVGGDF